MIDKVGIKIDPKHTIFIQVGDTLPDILPLLQTALTGDKIPDNRPETLRKIRLSISIGVSAEKELPPCR
ncbi:MAG: hypothetical protein PHS82_11685 [Lachnospiraceae bacterium]|nr:hypothetical protein [Lachnospiraceae bacterium]